MTTIKNKYLRRSLIVLMYLLLQVVLIGGAIRCGVMAMWRRVQTDEREMHTILRESWHKHYN